MATTIAHTIMAKLAAMYIFYFLRSHAGERGRKVREKKNNIFTF